MSGQNGSIDKAKERRRINNGKKKKWREEGGGTHFDLRQDTVEQICLAPVIQENTQPR